MNAAVRAALRMFSRFKSSEYAYPVFSPEMTRTPTPRFTPLAALLMIWLPRSGMVIATVVALGLVGGAPAGPIMSLPARVLQPATRAIGMGLFFTMFYGCMMLGPVAGGAFAKWTGSAAAAFDFGAAMALLCPVLLWGFNRIVAGATNGA